MLCLRWALLTLGLSKHIFNIAEWTKRTSYMICTLSNFKDIWPIWVYFSVHKTRMKNNFYLMQIARFDTQLPVFCYCFVDWIWIFWISPLNSNFKHYVGDIPWLVLWETAWCEIWAADLTPAAILMGPQKLTEMVMGCSINGNSVPWSNRWR